MSGYTRQSAADIIATATVKAAPINAEYNKLRDAFTFDSAGITGHKHDGSSDEGSYVPLIADLDGLNKVVVDTSNNRVGVFVEVSSSAVEQVRFQDGAIVPVTTNDIDLGTASLEFKNAYFDGVVTSDSFAGPLTGNVTGDLTGNVTGNVTGDVTGNLTGNVTGDVTGDLTGNVTGNVTGDVTGDLTGNVTGNLTGNITGDVTGNLTGNVTGNITSSGSSTFSGTITVPTPSSATDAATKAYVDSQLNITVSDFSITESGTDLNFSYLGTTIATMDSSGGLDVDSLAINGTPLDTTLATLSKSFIAGEESTLTLSSSVTSGVPVVSVTKEVPQTGITNNNWDVATNGSNYDRHDTAYSTTLTPSNASGDGTFTLGTGSFASSDVGKTIEGNGGEAVLTATDGSYSLVTAFNDSSTISSGDWSMYALTFDATNGVELSNIYIGLSTASYDSVSFSVASEEPLPFGLTFNNDGTKMYITGGSTDSVFQYSLSTGFDLSTASYDSVSFSVASQASNPQGIAFNNDGTKMYIVGSNTDSVFQYSLSTAFDLSTASYDSVSFSVASEETVPSGLTFNNDGTKMYIVGSNNDTVYQYSLSTGFDLSTASYDSVSFSVASEETVPSGLTFNNDGTKMYIIGTSTDSVFQYSLSTGFDLSTASYDSVSFSVASEETDPQAIAFNNDLTKMYIVGFNTDSVFQYSTGGFYQATAQYSPAVTNAGGGIDTTYWSDINSMTTTEIAGDGNVYYAVSTDNRTTWKVIDNSTGERSIVRNNAGTWEYNSNVTYSSTTWTSATTNSELAALQEALSVTQNQMDKTQLEAVTDANHYTLSNDLDLMIALYLPSTGVAPSSDGVSINYDANIKNAGAVLGTDYDWDFPASDKVRITSNITGNLKIRVV